MNEGKQTFIELLIGIAFFGILFAFLGIAWADKVAYYIGLIVGIFVSLYLIYDMYTSLRKGITMDSKSASGYIRKKTFFRIVFIVVVFLVAVFVENIDILSVLLGAMTLKLSAYLQPLTNKILTKFNKGR